MLESMPVRPMILALPDIHHLFALASCPPERKLKSTAALLAVLSVFCGLPALSSDSEDSMRRTAAPALLPPLPESNSEDFPDLKNRPLSTGFKAKQLPAEPAQDHDKNKVLDLGPLQQSMLIPLSTATRPIRLEASYNEPVSLEEALRHALKFSLPIRIAKESWVYQKWGLYGQFMSYMPLPGISMGWNLAKSHIEPDDTASNSRLYSTTQSYPLFAGWSAFYATLAQYYRERGWKQSYISNINDTLLNVYAAYTNLRLSNTLLQIKAKALEVSRSQLNLNNALYMAGTGTQFAIMQSRTQLGADQQALLQQQVDTRKAAINLAYALNTALSINLMPKDEVLAEDEIIDERISVDNLFNLALQNRPELRMYELYQVAAARSVQQQATAYYPSASAFTSFTHASTTSYPSTADKNNALIQQVIQFNLKKLANQSGSSSSSSAASAAASASSNFNAGIFGGLTDTVQAGLSLGWSLSNMGVPTACNIVSARALSRQAMWQANQQLLIVEQQVRSSYLNAITARAQIDSTAYGVASAREELRLAMLRLKTGVGTNLELIQAQRDFITALTSQAQAIAASNQAQAQLLHDTGMISVETLTRGYFPDRPFSKPGKKP
jgi:outer membrane protein TolC